MIALLGKILTIASISFAGVYYVTGMAMENVVLKFDKAQNHK